MREKKRDFSKFGVNALLRQSCYEIIKKLSQISKTCQRILWKNTAQIRALFIVSFFTVNDQNSSRMHAFFILSFVLHSCKDQYFKEEKSF